jgi:hypothetical protein
VTKRTKGNCRVCRDSPRLITSWVDLPCPADSRRFRAPHIAGPGRTRRFQAVPIGLVTDAILLGWTTECLLCASGWNSSVGESARAACGTTSPADLRAQVPHNARASSRSRVPPSAGPEAHITDIEAVLSGPGLGLFAPLHLVPAPIGREPIPDNQQNSISPHQPAHLCPQLPSSLPNQTTPFSAAHQPHQFASHVWHSRGQGRI